jgi:hypothetical protein
MLLLGLIQDDEYKLALYSSKASIGPSTDEYTPKGEVTGQGYKPGGVKLTNCRVHEDEDSACMSWDSPTIPNASITAGGFMIYNVSRGNTAVFIGSWNADYTSTNGPFKVNLADGQVVFS